MLRKLLVWSGLVLLAVVSALAYFVTQTELGQWVSGLFLVFGGAIAASAQLYDTQTATVTSIERAAKRDAFISATVEVAYVDGSGASGSARKQVVHQPSALETLEVGDKVQILICRSDSSIVRIPRLSSIDSRRCEPSSAE